MPGRGKGRGITSLDYKGGLRRPGEQRTTSSSSQDGDEHVTSAAEQTDRGGTTELSPNDSSGTESNVDKQVVNTEENQEDNQEKKQENQEEIQEENEENKNNESDISATKSNEDKKIALEANQSHEENSAISRTPDPKTPISMLSDTVVVTSKLSPYAKVFEPKSHFQSPVMSKPPHLSTKTKGPDSDLIDSVKDIIFQLTLDPGEFEAHVDGLVETMEGWIIQEETLKVIADLIITQSVTEPNFTYTGARLADYLDKNMNLGQDTKEKFRVVFVNRCKEELLKKDELKSNPSCEPSVLGFTKFLAELFCNFRSWNNGEPFQIFHKGLLQMLDVLIEHGSDDAFYCIGQIMKMTGYLIDDPVYKNLKDREHKVDRIFDSIQKAIEESNMCSSATKNYLQSLLLLRQSNWGQGEPGIQTGWDLVEPLPEGVLDSSVAYYYTQSNTETDNVFNTGVQWSTGTMDYYNDGEYYQYLGETPQDETEQINTEFEGGYDDYDYSEAEDPEFAEVADDFEKFLAMQ